MEGIDMKRIVSIGIVVLLCLLVLMLGDNARGDNLAGDLDQLPKNEEMLNLSGVELPFAGGHTCYKNGTWIRGIIVDPGNPDYRPPDNLFNREHSSVCTVQSWVQFYFAFPLKITRIRLYPKGNDIGEMATDVYIDVMDFDLHVLLNRSDTESIVNVNNYLEFQYNNLISSFIQVRWEGTFFFNEIEIYYDYFFSPYYMTGGFFNNSNITRIVNEYHRFTNETHNHYQNDTYINYTYLNATYENITCQNDTYLNQTNQTGITYMNTTVLNNTYLNDTVIQDNQLLEDKLNNVWEQLNESKKGEEGGESKSLADKTYTDPILIILLLAILIFQIILFIQRKKGQGELSGGNNTIEPEVEHTPSPGFSKETEIDLITRKVHQERSTDINPPPTQYAQYQHRPPQPQQPSTPIPPEQSQ